MVLSPSSSICVVPEACVSGSVGGHKAPLVRGVDGLAVTGFGGASAPTVPSGSCCEVRASLALATKVSARDIEGAAGARPCGMGATLDGSRGVAGTPARVSCLTPALIMGPPPVPAPDMEWVNPWGAVPARPLGNAELSWSAMPRDSRR